MTSRMVLKPTLDARDHTPNPPAMLDPASVLRNRERVRVMLATGKVTWPRGENWIVRREDWIPC